MAAMAFGHQQLYLTKVDGRWVTEWIGGLLDDWIDGTGLSMVKSGPVASRENDTVRWDQMLIRCLTAI